MTAGIYDYTWLSDRAANYFAKNAQELHLSNLRYGPVFGGWTNSNSAATAMALGAVVLNEGSPAGDFGRAIYVETMHKVSGGSTVGLEMALGNYTTDMPAPNPYNVGDGCIGIQIEVEGGYNYVTDPDNTPVTAPTEPANAFMMLRSGSQGSTDAAYRCVAGVVVAQDALYRDIDGLTGKAVALQLGDKHEVAWWAASSIKSASIRADYTAIANEDTHLIFSNRTITLGGYNERAIVEFSDISGTAVNSMVVANAASGFYPTITAQGTDTNVGLDFVSQGTGAMKFTINGAEAGRFEASASTPVNFPGFKSAPTANPVLMQALGSDSNIDIRLLPKGTGYLRFGAFTSNADAPITGYVSIRTDDGTVRKLAVIA